MSFAESFHKAAHPWPHCLGEATAHITTLNSCGFILSKSYAQALPWMQTGNWADWCMPVGMYTCTQITRCILPSFNLPLFLLIPHVLSMGWVYQREDGHAEVLAVQLASPHSHCRQRIVNQNFTNRWWTAIATWNRLPKARVEWMSKAAFSNSCTYIMLKMM